MSIGAPKAAWWTAVAIVCLATASLAYAADNPVPFPELPPWMWQLLLWIMTPLFLAASGALVWSKLHQLREHDEMLSSHAQRLGSLEGSRRAQEIQNAQHAEELRQQYAQFTAGVEAKIDTLVDAIDRGNQHTKDLLMQQWEVLTGVERKLDGHMEDETKRLISEAGQRIKQAERETELLAVLERLSTKLGIS